MTRLNKHTCFFAYIIRFARHVMLWYVAFFDFEPRMRRISIFEPLKRNVLKTQSCLCIFFSITYVFFIRVSIRLCHERDAVCISEILRSRLWNLFRKMCNSVWLVDVGKCGNRSGFDVNFCYTKVFWISVNFDKLMLASLSFVARKFSENP